MQPKKVSSHYIDAHLQKWDLKKRRQSLATPPIMEATVDGEHCITVQLLFLAHFEPVFSEQSLDVTCEFVGTCMCNSMYI